MLAEIVSSSSSRSYNSIGSSMGVGAQCVWSIPGSRDHIRSLEYQYFVICSESLLLFDILGWVLHSGLSLSGFIGSYEVESEPMPRSFSMVFISIFTATASSARI